MTNKGLHLKDRFTPEEWLGVKIAWELVPEKVTENAFHRAVQNAYPKTISRFKIVKKKQSEGWVKRVDVSSPLRQIIAQKMNDDEIQETKIDEIQGYVLLIFNNLKYTYGSATVSLLNASLENEDQELVPNAGAGVIARHRDAWQKITALSDSVINQGHDAFGLQLSEGCEQNQYKIKKMELYSKKVDAFRTLADAMALASKHEFAVWGITPDDLMPSRADDDIVLQELKDKADEGRAKLLDQQNRMKGRSRHLDAVGSIDTSYDDDVDDVDFIEVEQN